MKRISLAQLLASHRNAPYKQQYDYILNLIKSGRIKTGRCFSDQWEKSGFASGVLAHGGGKESDFFIGRIAV